MTQIRTQPDEALQTCTHSQRRISWWRSVAEVGPHERDTTEPSAQKAPRRAKSSGVRPARYPPKED